MTLKTTQNKKVSHIAHRVAKPLFHVEDFNELAALKLVGPHRSISTLSLREVAREAGIAPNSFYRSLS